ncbi:unnamed protein product [Ectocarpus sp. CCAP 1310/34]|nr:unnamed protein product [Ectocarpus sp. CCAP 1310/34]
MWLAQPRIALTRRRWASSSSLLLCNELVVAPHTQRNHQHQLQSKIVSHLRASSSATAASTCGGSRIHCSRTLGAVSSPAAGSGSSRWATARGRRRRSSAPGREATAEVAPQHRGAQRNAPAAALDQDGGALLRRVARYIEEDPGAADKLGKAMDEGSGRRLKDALDGMEYAVREPSLRQLRRVAFISAVPFVGFGIMDNAIMIVAGEYIDMTVGIAMGISTMAAAALGNTISDVAGVGLGGVIENLATRLGLPPSKLSRAQMLLQATRTAGLVGSAIGVLVGCLIGMFPLLFMPDPEVMEAVKRKEKIVGLVDAVVEEAAAFLSATSATLFILDREHEILWARRRGAPGTPNAGALQDLKIELAHRGAVSDAARNGEPVIMPAGAGGAAPSMLCMPVYGADGLVAGVVQVVGKKSNGKAIDGGFTADDAKDLSALCSHISVALENIKRADEADEVDLRETISLMQSYGGVKQHPFPQHRSNSARIAPCAAGKTAGIGGGGGGVIANDVDTGK